MIRTRATLNYSISRAELAQLAIDVPADQKVVNVFDANVRQWSVEPVEGGQRITAQLFEPAKSSQQVTVELEKFSGEKAQSVVAAPVVKAVGVGRQQGVIVVQVAEGLQAEAAKTSGLLQVDVKDLPPALQQGKWAFSYRYATAPFELALAIEKVQPQISVDSLCEAFLEPDRLSLDLAAVYTIEKAGVFRLEFDIPAGYEVRKVEGASLAGAAAAQVDTHHLEGPQQTQLVVNLSHKAIGRVGLAVQLQKDLHEPELLAPSDKAATLDMAIPRARAGRGSAGHRAAGDLCPGESPRQSGQDRRPAEHLVQRGLRERAVDPPREAGWSAARAGLCLCPGTDRVHRGRRAPQAAGHGAPARGGPRGRGRGQVSVHFLLQRPLQRREIAANRRAGGSGRRLASHDFRRARKNDRPRRPPIWPKTASPGVSAASRS